MNKKTIFIIVVCFIIFSSVLFLKKESFSRKNHEISEIKFSISPRIYPFEFYNNKKEIDGFDFDFANLLAKELKKKPIIKDSPILASFELLKINDFDAIISTILLSEWRKKQKDFLLSDPYIQDRMIFIFKKDRKYKEIKDFDQKKISCSYGCFMFKEWFEKNIKTSEQLYFDSSSLEIHALFEEKVDAILINKHEGLYLLEKYKNKLDFFDKFDLKTEYIILINGENKKLQNEINEAIKKVHQSQEFERLKKKWGLDK